MTDGARPALVAGDVVWTRRALDARVRSWAAAVRALHDGGAHVAVDLPHGAEGVAAWLGVLAAGRACLALDGAQPASARAAQLAFADARVLLAEPAPARALRDAGWSGVVLDPARLAPSDDGMPPADPDAPACLHYTSGSSGDPKAVVWTHRTLARAARNLDAMFGFGVEDRHALLAPLAVAATAAQVVACRAAGACLHLHEARRSAPPATAAWLRDHRITTLQTVPALFRTLVGDASAWRTVRALKLGGETVTTADAERFAACAASGAVLINGLGLTEAGFNVCWHRWTPGERLDGATVPIGRAAPDLELLLDDGELVVRSPDLAAGFWRDDARTAARYRDVRGRPGWRELRTGDAARVRADGLFEHAGRRDALIKVRGHRVDPAEVEAALAALDGVREVALLTTGGEPPRLVAFVVAAGLTPAAVRRALAATVPSFLVPATIRVVGALPRLTTGKVDRRALAGLATPATEVVAPRDALERTLHASFRRVLPEQEFGVTESFFELGGDSLAAAELVTAIATVLHVELPLAELSLHPSVEQLATRIRAGGWNLTDEPVALLSPAPARDATPLFVWPGAGSDVMALADLACHLGPSVAFHAIQHRGADGRRVWDTRLADMAERGVSLVRRVQPRGPYALCGTSFGGLVALEVARRLRALGESVPVLALLDTYAPGYPPVRRGLGIADRLRLVRRALRPLGHKDEPGWATLRRGLREQALRLRARLALRRPRPDAPPLPVAIRFVYLQEACFRATRSLRLARYDGPVDLYRVDSPPPPALFALDDALGWRPFVTGPLRIAVIPGRHSWHLREPHVRTLADKLRASLAHVGTPQPAAWDAGRLWDGLAAWWDEHAGDGGSASFRETALAALERLLDVRPGDRVLDVACGTGWLARRLSERGGVVTGVDLSDGMLRHARARAGDRAIDFRRMDVTRAADWDRLDAAAYDVAVCNLALHDLSDVAPLFAGLPRTLRPSGRLVLGLVHPAPLLRGGVVPDVPTPRLAAPGQPHPHVEVTRPLPDLWRLAGAAGWRVDDVVELPAGEAPTFAVAVLRFGPR